MENFSKQNRLIPLNAAAKTEDTHLDENTLKNATKHLKHGENNVCEIEFYKNSKSLGLAFTNQVNSKSKTAKILNFPIGEYFPTISLYRSCQVEVNFSPDTSHLPTGVKAFSKRVTETVVEGALSDALYRIDENQLKKRSV